MKILSKKILQITIICILSINLIQCSKNNNLPKPEILIDSQFGIDKNINMNTIDEFLNRDDVCYVDVRMLYDPAAFTEIGGESDLSATIKGFQIIPYPYIGSLQNLPVSNAYNKEKLFDISWADDGSILNVKENYVESDMILNELFPRDKKIFLMCGGGGYANMMKQLLLYKGYDENLLYNIGANWEYKGKNKLELIVYPENVNDNKIYASWRANYKYFDFAKLNKIN